MSQELKLTIDGVEITAHEGDTIIEAADEAGIYIPRLCYLAGLSPHGSCRTCTVVANGRHVPACTTPVADDMVVENDTLELTELRRSIVDMLFVSGNHFCMFCERSGSCELQALAYRLGIMAPKHPYLYPTLPVVADHPDVMIDHNRCILCARCIRASQELDGKHVFDFVGRGKDRRIAVNARSGLGATELDAADQAARVCPVGAIIVKRTGFRVPIGERPYDEHPIGSDIEARLGPTSTEAT